MISSSLSRERVKDSFEQAHISREKVAFAVKGRLFGGPKWARLAPDWGVPLQTAPAIGQADRQPFPGPRLPDSTCQPPRCLTDPA